MDALLRSLDPIVIGTVLVPICVLGAAWSLRMACAICSVQVPDFLPATAIVIVCVLANLGLRIALNHNEMQLSLVSQLLLVLLLSATLVAVSVRTSIASALAITITQVFLCGLMYFGLNEVGHAMF